MYRLIETLGDVCNMLAMAKERKKLGKLPISAEPVEKPKPHRDGIALSIWLDKELGLALVRQLRKTRRTKTEEVSIALERWLTDSGEWPPPKIDE